jgi:hypothetical protein
MAEQKPSLEELFRSALQDVELIIEKLSPHCGTLEEMMELIQLARSNNAQLKILHSLVIAKK